MADALIDELLVKKDNLSADVPAGWIDDAEAYDFTPFPKEMPDINFETLDGVYLITLVRCQ